MDIIGEGLKVLREEGVRAFIREASSYVFPRSRAGLLSPLVAKRFKEATRNIDEIHDALDFAFSFQAFVASPTKPSSGIAHAGGLSYGKDSLR